MIVVEVMQVTVVIVIVNANVNINTWRRSTFTVVERWSLTGELSLSCARLLAGRMITLWVRLPLSVSQHGQLSHPSIRGRKMSSNPHVISYMDYGVKAYHGSLGRSMPAGSITAGPKSVTRAIGAATLRRGTMAFNANQPPLPRL